MKAFQNFTFPNPVYYTAHAYSQLNDKLSRLFTPGDNGTQAPFSAKKANQLVKDIHALAYAIAFVIEEIKAGKNPGDINRFQREAYDFSLYIYQYRDAIKIRIKTPFDNRYPELIRKNFSVCIDKHTADIFYADFGPRFIAQKEAQGYESLAGRKLRREQKDKIDPATKIQPWGPVKD